MTPGIYVHEHTHKKTGKAHNLRFEIKGFKDVTTKPKKVVEKVRAVVITDKKFKRYPTSIVTVPLSLTLSIEEYINHDHVSP